MSDLARKASISVSFNGTDISAVVSKYLMSLSFTDNEEDEADDLQIKLQDRDGTWLQKWLQDFIDAAGGNYDKKRKAKNLTCTVNDSHAGIYQTVQKGTSSFDAALCQAYLIALGYMSGTPKTKADASLTSAVTGFQRANSLGVTGKCDRATWKKLVAAVNGKTITQYDYTFKASAAVKVRKSTKSSAKKVTTVPRGKKCIVTEKKATGWYKVTYDGKTGDAKGGSLKLESVTPATDEKTSGKKKLRRLRIHASISRVENGKTITTDCGSFQLDDVKAYGHPSTVMIKGTSLEYKGLRDTENDKSWENYTLKGIGTEIAKKHGMGIMWDCPKDKKYNRVEQAKQTDIAFLKKLCQDCGYSLKITKNKIVIYDQEKYEAQQEIAKFTFGDGTYLKWSFTTGEGQTVYDKCIVQYTDPKTKKVIKGEAVSDDYEEPDKDDKNAEKPVILNIKNQKVSSVAEAKALAEKELKLANKFERAAQLTVRGNPNYCAGMTVRLYSFGYWSGKYLIKAVKHDVTPGNGYVSTLTLRKADEVKKPTDKPDDGGGGKKEYKIGDVVTFKGGYHYKSSTRKDPTGGKRRAGLAKITHITDLKRPHPYGLQGGYYNSLSGNSNVHGWVDKDSFE